MRHDGAPKWLSGMQPPNMAYLDSWIESRWVGLSFASSAGDPRGRDSTRIYGL
jgi:hypothetical protein